MISEQTILFDEAVDDAWAYAFAMSLGTRSPTDLTKGKFVAFVRERMMTTQGELSNSPEDIISFIPDFIEHLGEW